MFFILDVKTEQELIKKSKLMNSMPREEQVQGACKSRSNK